jgi:hypothetical protein
LKKASRGSFEGCQLNEPGVCFGLVELPESKRMDKKEINSPKLTENFLFWVCGIGGLLLVLLFAHFVYHVI